MRTIDDLVLFLLTLFVAFSLLFSGCESVVGSVALAQDVYEPSVDDESPVIESPVIEWTDSTRLALAQCFVAEAGWRSPTEHAAIAHVLERRWRRYLASHPGSELTFEGEVRQYCHVHRVSRERSSNGWALGLQLGHIEQDPRLPSDPRPMCTGDDCWRRYDSRWLSVQESVAAFERGELADPMPLAILFGGRMDSAGSEVVWLGPTTHSIQDGATILLHNRFYALRTSVARAARGR